MKKWLGFFISGLLLVLLFNYLNYLNYGKITNNFVNNVINEIVLKYPDVDSEDVIKIINSDKKYSSDLLKKYGFSENDINYLQGGKIVYYKSLIISLSVFGIFFMLLVFILLKKKKNYDNNIESITNYLKKINSGIYDLNLLDNVEGNLSILKNEIYTTTVCLKESYDREYKERKAIKDNLANISHQLKTPLTAIILMIDTLLEEDVDPLRQKEFLSDIRLQVENINFLIIAMLKLSKFDANVITLSKDEIMIKDLVFDVLKNVDILREIKNVNIHVKGSSLVKVIGDYKWECEAVTNVLKNAIEYSNDSGDIYINFENNGMYVKLEIMNEGKEIEKTELKNIFKRFYKGNNNSNNIGIGLSLAKEIIEKDNGSISAYSQDGKTKFVLKYYK